MLFALLLVACNGSSDSKDPESGTIESQPTGNDSNGGGGGDSDTTIPDSNAWAQVAAFMGEGQRNIVVFLPDTLRADRLPTYGYERDTTPLTGSLPWVKVDSAYSVSSWTPPTVGSLLTGMDAHVHGVRVGPSDGVDSLVSPTFIAKLQEQGYTTAFFSGSGAVIVENGLAADFGTYERVLNEPTNSIGSVAAAQSWLESNGWQEPFLLWIQGMDTHQPWNPDPSDRGTWADMAALPFTFSGGVNEEEQQEDLRSALETADETTKDAIKQAVSDLYDEEILGIDRALSELLDNLSAGGVIDNTLVVFMSDHGETLFDQGDTFGHGGSLREELVHVPMMFYNPSFTAGTISNCLYSHVDFFPTLLGSDLGMGTSGYPLFTDETACRPLVRQSLYRTMGGEVSLQYLGIETLSNKVQHDCTGGVQTWDGAEDAAMQAELSTYLAEIVASSPTMTCAGL